MLQLIGFVRSRMASRPAPRFPDGLAAKLPDEDAADEIPEKSETDSRLGFAEGQTFAIEYEDAKGDLSERRISVLSITKGANHIPCLMAMCHERQAVRQFRIDRVLTIIDLDGEIHEPPTDFLVENFGMDPAFAEASETGEVDLPDIQAAIAREAARKDRWEHIKRTVYWDMKALAGLAWSDGSMHPDERGVIVDHCLSLSAHFDLNEDEHERLFKLVKRQYPSVGAVERAIEEIWQLPEDRRNLFLAACARLVEADGVVDPSEVSFLQETGFGGYR